jgi:hypothetical protein
MKNIFLIIFFTLLVVSSHTFYQCSSGSNISSGTGNNDEMQNKLEQKSEQPAFVSIPFEKPIQDSGHYFTYRFRNSDDKILDIVDFLTILSSEGFNIVEAWYFPGPNCGYSRTTYHPQLIIKLKNYDSRLKNFNFTYLSNKLILKCSENTSMYVSR